MDGPEGGAVSTDPRLDDGDRAILRQCPFTMWVYARAQRGTSVDKRKLARIRALTVSGKVRGKIVKQMPEGYQYEVTLTDAGRDALSTAFLAGTRS